MELLLLEYKTTLKRTRKRVGEVKKQVDTCKVIMEDVRNSKLIRSQASSEAQLLQEEKKVLSSIVRDLEFTVEWLSTGRQPGNRRGADRLAAYQREKPFDPMIIERISSSYGVIDEGAYRTDEERACDEKRQRVAELLKTLTVRERDIYMLWKGEGFSKRSIAEQLHISHDNVKSTLSRVKKKIQQALCTYEEDK